MNNLVPARRDPPTARLTTQKTPMAAEATPAAGAAAKAVLPTAACRAGDHRAAMLRVVVKAMQFWAPQAKRALGECFVHLPVNPPHDDPDATQLTISVEAVGSGTVLVPALKVSWDTTVGRLKAFIQAACAPVSQGDIRLFVGHGGEELTNDLQSVRTAAVPCSATLVLMVVSQEETLLCLFESTRGGNWRQRTQWGPNSTAPLSAWHGVDCNGGGGVVALKLGSNNLQGACVLCPKTSA